MEIDRLIINAQINASVVLLSRTGEVRWDDCNKKLVTVDHTSAVSTLLYSTLLPLLFRSSQGVRIFNLICTVLLADNDNGDDDNSLLIADVLSPASCLSRRFGQTSDRYGRAR